MNDRQYANDRDYAVVVAISDYRDTASFKKLDGPHNDATDFIEWLTDRNGGDIPPKNIFQCLSARDGSKATYTDVTGMLGGLFALEHEEDQPIGRRLYVFLAGHGFTPSANLAMLHTVDSKPKTPVYISGLQWADCFFTHALFDEVVVCMDCCRDFEPTFQPPPIPCANRFDAAANQVKRLYLMATGVGKKSFEKEIDGKVRGVFSNAFVNALKLDAVDGQGRITAANLVDVVSKKFRADPDSRKGQFPSPVMTGDFVLFENRSPKRTRVTVTLKNPGATLQMTAGADSARKSPFAPLSAANGVVVFELPTGQTYLALATQQNNPVPAIMTFAVRDEPVAITV